MAFETKLVVREAALTGNWVIHEHLTYKGHTDTFIVPRGFITDLASVPPLFWTWFPPHGRYQKAAVVHDFLYVTAPPVDIGWGVANRQITRKEADGIFLRIMRELGVPKWKRTLMYRAVRLGGARGWAKARKRDRK